MNTLKVVLNRISYTQCSPREAFLRDVHGTVSCKLTYTCIYSSHTSLSECAYISTRRKYASNNEVCLISNNIPVIGSGLHLVLFNLAEFLEDDFSTK